MLNYKVSIDLLQYVNENASPLEFIIGEDDKVSMLENILFASQSFIVFL
jgi:hypothetical protein